MWAMDWAPIPGKLINAITFLNQGTIRLVVYVVAKIVLPRQTYAYFRNFAPYSIAVRHVFVPYAKLEIAVCFFN